jgi:hypothetical protein
MVRAGHPDSAEDASGFAFHHVRSIVAITVIAVV